MKNKATQILIIQSLFRISSYISSYIHE